MNILVFEEDYCDRNCVMRGLNEVMPEENHYIFGESDDALEFSKRTPIDVAFINIDKGLAPGYFLAKDILKIQRTNIVFTNYEWKCLKETFELRVSGYIRKPLQNEEVLYELQNLRYPLLSDDPNWDKPPVYEATPCPTVTRTSRRNLFCRIKNYFMRNL